MSEEIPLVCTIQDLARILKTSTRTIARQRKAGTFPIKELPELDRKPRWGRRDVEAFAARETQPAMTLALRRRA